LAPEDEQEITFDCDFRLLRHELLLSGLVAWTGTTPPCQERKEKVLSNLVKSSDTFSQCENRLKTRQLRIGSQKE
jgi:hypothetical protein